MVHPYLRRREGLENRSTIRRRNCDAVLGKTLGVPLFQEQAMQVAIVCAGFTPSEADQLRRAMATFKFTGGVSALQGQAGRRHGRARLRRASSPSRPSASSRASAATAFRKATPRQLRADRLCLVLDEVPSSRRLLRRAAQRPADGLLRAGADRARRARAWRRGPAGLHQRVALGLHAGGQVTTATPRPLRSGSACAWSRASPMTDAREDRRVRGPIARFARSRTIWRRCRRPGRRAGAAGRGRCLPAARPRPAGGALGDQGARPIRALPLAAAAHAQQAVPEVDEPAVALTADDRRAGGGGGLPQRRASTLRRHPLTFLREDLTARRRASCCGDLPSVRDGRMAARSPASCWCARSPAPPRA